MPKTSTTKLDNKVAVVTGAGSGIGRATAILLATEGATVTAADIDAKAAEFCAEEITAQQAAATAMPLDVSSEHQWRRVIDAVIERHHQLDVLVNNAGISVSKPLSDLSFDQWRKVMAVNLDGVFLGTKYAIQAMKKSQGGSIVNVASVSGIRPMGGATAYSVSKAALRMFTKTVAIECADAQSGVRINMVTPGGVKTPMWEKEEFFRALISEHGSAESAFEAMAGETPSHQFFSPEEIARTILYFASDESNHLTGAEIIVDRGHTG